LPIGPFKQGLLLNSGKHNNWPKHPTMIFKLGLILGQLQRFLDSSTKKAR
tara:strand:+ start:132 stop:281 length:150 start_codon:yes stop_codon:yes gene_type:complete